ncbi:MAG TPA: hypothetical protein ENN06_10505 [Desulfobacteraceae bacterium]|nr:hypothetical protein [Desulfobacteraceae bacterium]
MTQKDIMMDEVRKVEDFIEKTNKNLELISVNLLRHEKKPKDKEFIHDAFRTIRSIRNDALHAGFGRVSELAFHLAGLIDLVCQEKTEPDQDVIDVIAGARDRIARLVGEIESSRQERVPVKDLLDQISALEEKIRREKNAGPDQQPAAAGIEKLPPEESVDLSLLPPEMTQEEYNREVDRELLQIYLDQTQENLSLLRALANSYTNESNREGIITLCSDLVSKLQSSAHYMGYQRLADFYLQWVAELEMMSVELSVGSPVSFDFMDGNIKRIAALFPQVKDIPADPAHLEKAMAAAREESRAGKEARADREQKNIPPVKEQGNIAGEPPPGKPAPLSGPEQDAAHGEMTAPSGQSRMARREAGRVTPVALDASFLEEERRRNEFDEELFRIFVQHLHEKLAQLQVLADRYPQTRDKSRLINECSDLVGKLQYSANYMGYEPLAEYCLQWIAELEMADIDLSLGNKVSMAFMEQRISEIAALFPSSDGDISPEPGLATSQPRTTGPGPADEFPPLDLEETDFPFSLKGLFSRLEEAENEEFDDNEALVSALAAQEPGSGTEPPPDIDAAVKPPPAEAPPHDGFEKEIREDVHPAPESEDEVQESEADADSTFSDLEGEQEKIGPYSADPSRSDLLRKLSAALKSLDEEPSPGEPESPLFEERIPGEEIDADLYEKLLQALQTRPDSDAVEGSAHVDQVMEEILTARVTVPDHGELLLEPLTIDALTAGRTQAFPADAHAADACRSRFAELLAERSSLARLYRGITSFDFDPREAGRAAGKLKSLNSLLSRLDDNGLSGGRATREIIAGLLKIRMMPVSRLFNLFRNVVARQAEENEKKVCLDIQGQETEIDQSLLRDLEKCLMPIVANAVDHGLESPAERRHAGKDEFGSLRLAAHQDHRHLFIEIGDDGRGIDPGKVKSAALAANLYSGEELYRMSDAELVDIILAPGYPASTGAAARNHGDGMNKVKSLVDRLNGSISIKSTAGKGTQVRLQVPLRVPLFRALKFTAGSGNYAVPLSGVEEVLRLVPGQIMQDADGESIMLRGERIPVYALNRFIDIDQADREKTTQYIVIMTSGPRKTGLIVDSLIGLEVVVIKALAEHLIREKDLDTASIEDEEEIASIPDIEELMHSVRTNTAAVTESRAVQD